MTFKLPSEVSGDFARQTRESLKAIASSIFIDGRLVEDIEVDGEVEVQHGLGRAARGFIVVDKNAGEHVWRVDGTRESTHITLDASGAVTVSIWVF